MSNNFNLSNDTDAYESLEVGDTVRYKTLTATDTGEIHEFDKHGRPLVEIDVGIGSTLCHIPRECFVEAIDDE